MTNNQIQRYIDLSARMLEIILDSGINWKPEHETELKAIKAELKELRPLVDAEHRKEQDICQLQSVMWVYRSLTVHGQVPRNWPY